MAKIVITTQENEQYEQQAELFRGAAAVVTASEVLPSSRRVSILDVQKKDAEKKTAT